MTTPRLIELRQITGTIIVETGLRIGGSQESMEISGLDNPIIRNPANAEPYITGSSLKGKLRSLAEWCRGEIPDKGDVTRPRIGSDSARVFGIPAANPKNDDSDERRAALTQGPTRLLVRDAPLSESSRQAFREGRPITEVKSENSINRLTSMANPRPMERVLPGVEFQLDLVYRIFDVDDDGGERDRRLFTEVLLQALALVEADALGGGSSRGNGKVRFANLSWSSGKGQQHSIELPGLEFSAN
jgi:CRISPR-associated protein Csm3